MAQKLQLTPDASQKAQELESKFASNGRYLGATTYEPKDGRIYVGDGRDHIEPSEWMVDVNKYHKGRILGASGETDKVNSLQIFSENYTAAYEDYMRVKDLLEQTYQPYYRVMGAAGKEAVTNYENVRRIADLLDNVSGQMYIMEDFQAMNIAEVINSNAVRFRYITKTSDRLLVQPELSDDAVPEDVRQAYTMGSKDIFADGISFSLSMRDKDVEFDIVREITKDFPGAFMKAKNDKVLTVINALTGNNQGDWDAFSGGRFDVQAAEQMQAAEDVCRKYGGPLVAIMNSDTWRLYVNNLGAFEEVRPGNMSTEGQNMKMGHLTGNPMVQYFIDDGLTAKSYVMAAKPSFMKCFQGMMIQTSYTDERTAGQTEKRFLFDYNGIEVTDKNAVFRGTTVGS